ncbi:MAG: hypothetical protein RBS96_02605 [Dehalococcoidales bacterium]|nr:hypothetical protein [Syntrophales bacterium]MDX9802906.1 hypothetical protein [Dehalococcoidales bacterium]
MTQFTVLYRKNPTFVPLKWERPASDLLQSVLVYLATVEANTPDEAFTRMQGENWSPNGEARPLILGKGLQHTSMSVGDALVDGATGTYYLCHLAGWNVVQDTDRAV